MIMALWRVQDRGRLLRSSWRHASCNGLLTALSPMFARIEPRLQAAESIHAVMSDLPKRNGWTIAEHTGDHSPSAC
ncbi:hypothetical protein [Nonomuraea rubra]|uniref:hypothetical protein n=1 Tax=Nonomuraea rubra TaxID=46180 RepID=UPI0034018000